MKRKDMSLEKAKEEIDLLKRTVEEIQEAWEDAKKNKTVKKLRELIMEVPEEDEEVMGAVFMILCAKLLLKDVGKVKFSEDTAEKDTKAVICL